MNKLPYILLLLLSFCPSIAFAVNVQNPILIISSYNPESPNMSRNIQDFEERYWEYNFPHQIRMENMNCRTFHEAASWKSRMDAILKKYINEDKTLTPTAIILLGQEAWSSYLALDYAETFSIPVLTGLASRNFIKLPSASDTLDQWNPESLDVERDFDHYNILSGIFIQYDIDRNINLVKTLFPHTKSIAFVTDNTYGGVALQSLIRQEVRKFPQIEPIFLDGRIDAINTLLLRISELPENTVVMIGTWRVDKNESYFLNRAIYSLMKANKKTPAFSITTTGLGYWAMGGYVPEYTLQGAELADKLADILKYKVTSHSNLQFTTSSYKFDAIKLKEFGIKQFQLPPNSILLNDRSAFVEKYQYLFPFMGAIIAFILFALITVVIYLLKAKKLNAALLESETYREVVLNNIDVLFAKINNNYEIEWQSGTTSGAINNNLARTGGEKHCYARYFERDTPCEECSILKLRNGGSRGEVVLKCVENDHYAAIHTPLLDKAGILSGFIIRLENVTEREKANVELQKAKESAEESDRLKSLFLANMSHEIRTPLNAIVGFSEIISQTENEVDKQEYLEIIANNNSLLLQLIDDILDLSKIEAGTLSFVDEVVDVNKLLDEIFNVFLSKANDKKLAFNLSKALPICLINIDRHRLSQVVCNFLTNAFKFTQSGSVDFGYEEINNGLHFYVKDTGCGISVEKADAVFERFVKLNNFAQGTGLGLSICKMIVAKFNGEIGVNTKIGEGSVFWFTLPLNMVTLRKEKRLSSVSTIDEFDALKRTNITKPVILIVDNDHENYTFYSSIFNSDYNLIKAWDANEGLEMFKKFNPDLVMMDTNTLSKGDSGVVSDIRRHSKKMVPILAISLNDEIADLDQFGFNEIFRNTTPKKTIKERIETLLK